MLHMSDQSWNYSWESAAQSSLAQLRNTMKVEAFLLFHGGEKNTKPTKNTKKKNSYYGHNTSKLQNLSTQLVYLSLLVGFVL